VLERVAGGALFTHDGAELDAVRPEVIDRLIELATNARASRWGSDRARTVLLARLLGARAFGEHDLEANRAGRRSPGQRLRASFHALVAAGLTAGAIGWAFHVFSDATMRDRQGHPLPVGERITGTLCYLAFAAAGFAYTIWRVRVTLGPVIWIEGEAQRGLRFGHRGGVFYEVRIGGEALSISRALHRAILPGARYRAYRSVRDDALLSIEPA
jgi:hypothetical protein